MKQSDSIIHIGNETTKCGHLTNHSNYLQTFSTPNIY